MYVTMESPRPVTAMEKSSLQQHQTEWPKKLHQDKVEGVNEDGQVDTAGGVVRSDGQKSTKLQLNNPLTSAHLPDKEEYVRKL